MKRFKNILVLYGDAVGAEDALTQGTALARADGARLTLVDVLAPGNISPVGIREQRRRLERTVNALKLEGIARAEACVLIGRHSEEIIRQVTSARHDLVIAGSDGGNSFRNALYGSLATHLMRKCPCPVWIVKPGRARPYLKVLAAVDGDPTGDGLDVKIIDMATSLAAAHDAELHVLNAWSVQGKDRDTLRSEIRDATRNALLAKHEAVHRTRVDELLARYRHQPGRPVLHLPRGTPEQAICDAARDLGIDVIVMGTSSRTGLSGLLIGNAAESILASVRCGVLTVKPEGFASPVMLEEELAVA